MAISYTEFYCRGGGSNLNAGSTNTDASFITYTNGTWTTGTGVFDPAGAANPSTDGVTVGMYANIGGTFITRITAVSSTTFTCSLTACSGTNPGSGTITARVGGAFRGPNGTDQFPFNTLNQNACDASNNPVRLNMVSSASYAMTSGITLATNSIVFEGYTTSVGDGGRATISGGSSGASYNLITCTNNNTVFKNFIFDGNGATGTADGITAFSSTSRAFFVNCVFKNMKGYGVSRTLTTSALNLFKCEITGNGVGGILSSNTGSLSIFDCVIHDNTGYGILISGNTTCDVINSIFDTNTGANGHGIRVQGTNTNLMLYNCDFYNNEQSHVSWGNTNTQLSYGMIKNCNFFKAGAYAISASNGSTAYRSIHAINCAYGSGTQANTSGNLQGNVEDTSPVTFTSNQTPWTDPGNGDFTLTAGTSCINGGSLAFTQTTSSYGPTTGYADIGAAGSSSGGTSGGLIVPRTFTGF